MNGVTGVTQVQRYTQVWHFIGDEVLREAMLICARARRVEAIGWKLGSESGAGVV
jgi:hypothetical protein